MALLSFDRANLVSLLEANKISTSHVKTIFTKLYKDLDLEFRSKMLPIKKIHNLFA